MARDFAKSFYKSKLWQDTREAILKRDKYRCQMQGCYNPAEEVHHIKYLTPSNIGDVNITVNPANLICLCGDCHKAIHKGDKVAGIKKRATEHRMADKNKCILPEIEFDENGYPLPVAKIPPVET